MNNRMATYAAVLGLIAIAAPLTFVFVADSIPFFRGVGPFAMSESSRRLFRASMMTHNETFGRVVIITGANSGLGFASAKILASSGAHVVMGCRNSVKCMAAADRIKASCRNCKLDTLVPLDLSSLRSVSSFAASFNDKFGRLDALMLNAGIMAHPYRLSTDGIEMQFAVNHLGHFYLTELLLPTLKATSQIAERVHVTSVSSMMSFLSSMTHMKTGFFSSMSSSYLTEQCLNNQDVYGKIRNYAQSKMANILFSKELQRRLRQDGYDRIVSTSVNPGFVITELTTKMFRDLPGLRSLWFLLRRVAFFFAWDQNEAALTQVYAVTSHNLMAEQNGGDYIVPIARHGTSIPAMANDAKLARDLWSFSEKIIRSKGF